MEQLVTLSEALLSAEQLPWQSNLYLPSHRKWTEDSEAAVLDTENEEEPENPAFAQMHSLMRALSISDVQQIVYNAKQQRPNADTTELVQAFQFYFDRDAFIDFDTV